MAKGRFIDLFDPELPVITQKQVNPGEQAYLFNIDRIENNQKPQILASSSRVYEEKNSNRSYSFVAKSPVNTTNAMRILLPKRPKTIKARLINGQETYEIKSSWDTLGRTCFLKFENQPDGVSIFIEW